jgi:hypothetical protein
MSDGGSNMGDVDRSNLERHGRAVVWDAYCGEPIAWLAHGEPVAGMLYGGSGMVAYTHLLTIDEAIDAYGPITEWVVGPQGGFRRVWFGATVFSAPNSDVTSTSTLPEGVVTVEDLTWSTCPRCGAIGPKTAHRPSTGSVRPRREYQRLRDENAQLRNTVEQLRKQNDLLDAQVHARKGTPICNRPTRVGRPCQADAITYPVPIESCRIHLTAEEKAMLDAAFEARMPEGSSPA